MPRPQKNTVVYFPHYCNNQKTHYALLQQHGNNGYAFYYQLKELLGKSEGHYFDFSKPIDLGYLLQCTHVDESTAKKILDTLSEIEVLDRDLYKIKIIWIQEFVNSLAQVYARRKSELPQKPVIQVLETGLLSTEIPMSGNNGDNNPQSKGKDRNLEQSIEVSTPTKEIPTEIVQQLQMEYPTVNVNSSIKKYIVKKRGSLNFGKIDDMQLWLDRDKWEGWNPQTAKKNTTVTRYCPNCNDSKEVNPNKAYAAICPKCDEQLLHKFEIQQMKQTDKAG